MFWLCVGLLVGAFLSGVAMLWWASRTTDPASSIRDDIAAEVAEQTRLTSGELPVAGPDHVDVGYWPIGTDGSI